MASGGDFSDQLVAGGHAPEPGVATRPRLAHWHASIGKNSSHLFGLRGAIARGWPLQDIVVVNLDCDQVFAPSFLVAVLNSFQRVDTLSDHFVAACVPGVSASGGGGPLTGRIAVHGPSFLRIGLYDQEEGIVGSGGQDVDLIRRLRKVAQSSRIPGNVWEGVGTALPNHISGNLKRSNEAKVANMSEADFQLAGGRTWADVNDHNWALFKEKLSAGRYARNRLQGTTPEELLQSASLSCGAYWVAEAETRPREAVASAGGESPASPSPEAPPQAAGGEAPEMRAALCLTARPRSRTHEPEPDPDIVPAGFPTTVAFYTAGLLFVGRGKLHLGNMDRESARQLVDTAHRCGNEHRTAPNTTFQQALIGSGLAAEHDKCMEVDCRRFSDPDARKRGGLRHLGFAGSVLHKIATDRRFADFLENVLTDLILLGCQEPVDKPVHVVFFCKKGRHRSVAVAHLTGLAMAAITAWSPWFDHLASHTWPYETCNNCHDCARPTGRGLWEKQEAARLAVDVAKAFVRRWGNE